MRRRERRHLKEVAIEGERARVLRRGEITELFPIMAGRSVSTCEVRGRIADGGKSWA